MNITFVTSAQTDEEGYALLKSLVFHSRTLRRHNRRYGKGINESYREVKRAKLVAKYAAKRAALKEIVRTGSIEDAFEAAQKLQSLPKNALPVRLHNRCTMTGRPKGYMSVRYFTYPIP